MARGVLVLDVSYRPVDYVDAERAIVLLTSEKAQPVRTYAFGNSLIKVKDLTVYRSPSTEIVVPKVIQLMTYVPIAEHLSRHVTNSILFARDGYMCRYCLTKKQDLPHGVRLTRDHMKPVSSFEGSCREEKIFKANTWENVVTACTTCNNIKDDKMPWQVDMYPKKLDGSNYVPQRPNGVLLSLLDKVDDDQLIFVRDHLPEHLKGTFWKPIGVGV